MVTFEHEINKQPVLTINMDATDSTECIKNCVIAMRIHIHNNDKKAFVSLILSLSNTYAKFGGGKVTLNKDSAIIWIPKEAAQAAYIERTKRTMIDKAKNESDIVSYTVKSALDIDKINDACEIRIMVDLNDSNAREIIMDKIHDKWPNNLKINEIPMPGGIYIMIPESLAKETANRQKDRITNAAEKDDYAAWHAEMTKHAKVITSSIFCSIGWNSEELMKSLNFIIDSASEKVMKPEDCLQTFELHYIQSINFIYWGLRLSADMNEPNDDTRNKLRDAIFHACDILRNWTNAMVKSPGETVFELIHALSDDKKDENGDFIDIDYEYFGVFGMNLMHYLKGPHREDFTHADYDAFINEYNIIADGPYGADAWDIIYKNYIDIYKARHNDQEPDYSPLFTFANSFREWIIFSEIYQSLGIDKTDTDTRYKYYQLCTNKELYNAIYLNINAMQIPDFLTKYEYQVYCATKSDANSMQIEPMLFMLLRFYNTICAWKNFMNSRTGYQSEVKNFDDTLDFLIKNCKSKYLGYLAKHFL